MRFFTLLAAASFCAASTALAQPVLNEAYHGQPGAGFTYIDASNDATLFDTVTTTGQRHWDFSGLNRSGTGDEYDGTVIQASDAQAPLDFPVSDIVIDFNLAGDHFEFYLNNSPQGVTQQGNFDGTSYLFYQPARNFFPTGLGYGQSTSVTSFEKDVDQGMTDTTYYKIEQTLTYSAYGTLQIPGSAAALNVVLITGKDNYYIGDGPNGPYALSDTDTYYSWFVPGLGYPVLQYTRYDYTDGSSADMFANYLSNIVMGAKPAVRFKPTVLSPNPTRGLAALALPADETIREATVIDLTGRPVATLPLQNGKLNVAALPAGAYWIEARGRKTYRARLVKE